MDLWSLAWHSAPLEHGLPLAVVAAAVADPAFQLQFVSLATGVVKNAVADPGRRAIPRERSQAKQLRDDWRTNSNLTKLWWGHMEQSFFPFFGDDDGVLGIVAALDLAAFTELLGLFDSPYPIAGALWAASVNRSFSRWQALVSLAPDAFNDERRWNGSSIVPLLLFVARDQLQVRLGPTSSEDEIKAATKEIDDLAGEIAKVVTRRCDAAPCAGRWAACLMRQAMSGLFNEPRPIPTDARSRGYADAALISALARELPSAGWSPVASADADPWEPWCYHAVLVTVALTRAAPMPSVDTFLAEWALAPEEWPSERGQQLRAHASLFETLGKRADAYGTRMLALPLAEASAPDRVWSRLWESTSAIREVIEFGDADASEEEGWRGRSEASGLMRLAFGFGLMMMDHIIAPARELPYERQSVLEALLRSLTDAVREMSAIDRLDRGYWDDAIRHLAIRRATWLSGKPPGGAVAAPVVFELDMTPSLGDFIRDLEGDVEGVLAFVEVALRNHVDPKALQEGLRAAGIDLRREADFGERLLELDPKRAGIRAEQISAARSLLE